ncbi:MAG: hypothetical protein AAGK21_05730, partial [Bacteroidota bacterium]
PVERTSQDRAAPAGAMLLPEPRPPVASDGGLAPFAVQGFWDAFESGAYDALDRVRFLLTAAYLENPADPQVTLLLAHAHLWSVSERARLDTPDPTITDHLVLADAYFEEAFRLAPQDARIIGWLGSSRLPLGDLRRDSVLVAEGHALLRESVQRSPTFNHFTAGFILSSRPRASPEFADAVGQLWRNVDVCSGMRDASGGDAYEAALGVAVACANSEKAPHNYEGFMLTLGDVLLKDGRADEGKAIYRRAQLAPAYETWPYRDVLEQRLVDADSLVAEWTSGRSEPEIVMGSAYTCTVCHQRAQ